MSVPLFLFLLCLVPTKVAAQETFIREYRTEALPGGYFSSVFETDDGGYLTGGGGLMLKVDASGEPVTAMHIGFVPEVQQLLPTDDGGRLMVGIQGNDVGFYPVILRQDAAGNLLWLRELGGDAWNVCIEHAEEEGFLLAGIPAYLDDSRAEFIGNMLLFIDNDGVPRQGSVVPFEGATDLLKRSSTGGYFLSGRGYEDDPAPILVWLTSSGTIRLTKTLRCDGWDLTVTNAKWLSNGSIALVGWAQPDDEKQATRMFLTLLDSMGNSRWARSYSGVGRTLLSAEIAESSPGTVTVAGIAVDDPRPCTNCRNEGLGFCMTVGDDGEPVFAYTYLGEKGDVRIRQMKQTSDGGLIFVGCTIGENARNYREEESDFLIKTDGFGYISCAGRLSVVSVPLNIILRDTACSYGIENESLYYFDQDIYEENYVEVEPETEEENTEALYRSERLCRDPAPSRPRLKRGFGTDQVLQLSPNSVRVGAPVQLSFFSETEGDIVLSVVESATGREQLRLVNPEGILRRSGVGFVELNTTGYDPGLYLVQVEAEDETFIEKLIVR